MKRLALGIQYDGTPWQGWQTQPSGLTVQDRLEAALAKFSGHALATTCAGRTDTGVHALEQVVHVDTALERDSSAWVRGVNSFLPPSIVVRWASEVMAEVAPGGEGGEDDFHARFSARARTYHYVLHNHPIRSPLMAGKVGWCFRPLDIEAMRSAAACLVGTHDFSAFRSSQCQAKSPVKSLYALQIERHGDLIVITLRASAFLHHMVRNIVGSLIYCGTGRQPPAWLAEVLAARDRKIAAPTFMPDGLYLAKIEYDAKWVLPQEGGSALPWLPA